MFPIHSHNSHPPAWFFHSVSGFSLTVSQAFSKGVIPILQEWIFRVGRKPWKLAYKDVLTTVKMKKENNPGLVFYFIFFLPPVRMAKIPNFMINHHLSAKIFCFVIYFFYLCLKY